MNFRQKWVAASRSWLAIFLTIAAALFECPALANCTATNLGILPLPDRAYDLYKGFPAGLYPDFANSPPSAHLAIGLEIATDKIKPLNAAGDVDEEDGKIVMTSIGMSNTTQEFASKGRDTFKRRADADPSRNPHLVIVDGAQGGRASTSWTNLTDPTWSTVLSRLDGARCSSNQVQVLWMKQARGRPSNDFPSHAKMLQKDLEQILRNAKIHFPNLKMAYVSSRTRCYSLGAPESTLNPEPQAFESGFSVKWMIEKQISGDLSLNFDSAKGPVVAPYISWGPYLWADGTVGRSDGFIWQCNDLEGDLTHPNTNGTAKVGAQLRAFFKTDPTATPWFLKKAVTGRPPVCTVAADVTSGAVPLTVQFSANASDPDGSIRDYQWTFDDGTFSANADPVKIVRTPGTYRARVTVTDNDGNTALGGVTVKATSPAARLSVPSYFGDRIQFMVEGATNLNHFLHASTDLMNWISVQSNRGPFTFTDLTPSNYPVQFYRAISTP